MSSWSIPPTSALLKKATAIFLQEPNWVKELTEMGFENIRVAGDTRIDRTLALAQEAQQHIPSPLLQSGLFDIIAGSTWEEDDQLLIPLIEKLNLKAIIAPHDPEESQVTRLMQRLKVPAIQLSKMTKADQSIQVIVVDSIGLLAYLYALGKMAYIGGGFGKGIHNILEPAAHHLPILFGPRYHKFPEAANMIQSGAAMSVMNEAELLRALQLYSGENGHQAGEQARSYLEKNSGATQIVCSYIRESIPFGLKS